jgi:hypothetical protein
MDATRHTNVRHQIANVLAFLLWTGLITVALWGLL